MSLQKAMVSSKSNEWETPQDFFDKLNNEFGFTLDPCSNGNHKCSKYFTIKEDGLKQDWSKDIVFMNPPYGGHTGEWIKKALEESKKGAIVVCLIVSSTDRSYWHDYIFPYANQIRFIRGRLKFGNSKSTAPFASAVIIFGKEFNYKYTFMKESIAKLKQKGENTMKFKSGYEFSLKELKKDFESFEWLCEHNSDVPILWNAKSREIDLEIMTERVIILLEAIERKKELEEGKTL